jgi:hypothetical protein
MNIASLLQENFRHGKVFLDTSDIDIGEHFPGIVSCELNRATTVIALVNPEWLSSLDKNFRRRIDSPEDWVHIELATALKKNTYNSGVCRRCREINRRSASRFIKATGKYPKL